MLFPWMLMFRNVRKLLDFLVFCIVLKEIYVMFNTLYFY